MAVFAGAARTRSVARQGPRRDRGVPWAGRRPFCPACPPPSVRASRLAGQGPAIAIGLRHPRPRAASLWPALCLGRRGGRIRPRITDHARNRRQGSIGCLYTGLSRRPARLEPGSRLSKTRASAGDPTDTHIQDPWPKPTSAEGNARRRRPRSRGCRNCGVSRRPPALLRRTLSRLLWWRGMSGTHSRPRRQGHRKIGLSEFFTGYGMGAGPWTLSFLGSYLDVMPNL